VKRFLKIFNKKTKESEVEMALRPFVMSGGTVVSPDSAMKVSAFHRGVTYISTQIGKLPWNIKGDDNKIIYDRISSLLSLAPNPEMSSFTFRMVMIQNAIIWGNAYAEIERNAIGQPVALWFLPSESVEPTRARDGKLWYRVTGNVTSNQDSYLSPRDMFHIKNFHTKDGIVGQSIASFASDILGIGLGSDRFANALFANGGMPSGTLEVPGQLSDEAHKRLKQSWAESTGGRKTGSTAILEEGIKYAPISHDPESLQFLESRKFTVLDIARFLGLPPTKLFDTQAATFSNIENSNLEVAVDTLDAWCRAFESEADIKLLNGQFGGRHSELDLYAVFRGDMDTRSQYFTRMMQMSAMTPNEVREKEGLAEYEGGERFYIANNNFAPVDRIDEVLDAQIKSKNQPAAAPAKEEPKKPVDESKSDDTVVENKVSEAVIKFLERKSLNS
jgi:HK97 family phage portal protein